MRVVHAVEDLRRAVARARPSGERIGFVPTMGALHAGHLSLADRAAQASDLVVVSIFVNPTQFGPNEDYEAYPRDLARDATLAGQAGADLLFAPAVETMYPPGCATRVVQAGLTDRLEGASRPGHFDGVCTVCAKLFNLAQADVAFFGQKDYQQSLAIRRMVADLCVPVQIEVCPTVREPDGLAMSSRNRYLSAEEREQALGISRALQSADQMVADGQTRAGALRQAMESIIAAQPLAKIDYVAVVHPETLTPVDDVARGAVALVAVRIGTTRLIDNAVLRPAT